MNTSTALFHDRRAAGRALAKALHTYRTQQPVVLGIARGGVPVAYEVATALGAPLRVLVVRKIGAPQQPEFGIGAVAPGVTVQMPAAMAAAEVSSAAFDRVAAQARSVMEERHRRYSGDDPLPTLQGRTAIVIDDGLATGVTARAALRAARALDPAQLVFAVPVGATDSIAALDDAVDAIVCLHPKDNFNAVGQWYEHFGPTSDEEVIELTEEANRTVSDADLREPG